jgi:hypothetical protein
MKLLPLLQKGGTGADGSHRLGCCQAQKIPQRGGIVTPRRFRRKSYRHKGNRMDCYAGEIRWAAVVGGMRPAGWESLVAHSETGSLQGTKLQYHRQRLRPDLPQPARNHETDGDDQSACPVYIHARCMIQCRGGDSRTTLGPSHLFLRSRRTVGGGFYRRHA